MRILRVPDTELSKAPAEETKKPAEERIRDAFPEIEPSAGHDYVDELIGLLRVARLHIEDAERQRFALEKRHDEITAMVSSYLVASKGSVAESWLKAFVECKAVTIDQSYPTTFIAPVLHLPKA